MDCQIVILAAGNGKRMQSDLPKVMHKVQGTPMLERVLNNAKRITNDIIIVHSHELLEYIKPYQSFGKFALQASPLGTADAVYSALKLISKSKSILVLYGDNPYISSGTILHLFEHLWAQKSAVSTLAFTYTKPNNCGKLIVDGKGKLLKIVEFKKATNEEKTISLCNSGIMGFRGGILHKYLPHCLADNCSDGGEFYLTELVEICQKNNEHVSYLLTSFSDEHMSINTREDLLRANKLPTFNSDA